MSTSAPRILIHASDTSALVPRLSRAQPTAVIETAHSYDGLGNLIRTFKPDIAYSVAFNGRQGFPRDAFLGPDGPEWISIGGAGVDHLLPWDDTRTTVTNAAGVAAGMMAEYTFGMLLHFTLDIAGLQADQIDREWNGRRLLTPLQGKTMLIVGLGQNGQAVAARAKAFGLHVIGTRARPRDMTHVDEVHTPDALPGLWHRADFIVIATPLLPSTRALVDARAFAAMKPSALLVDISRGGVVDGAALTNALRAGTIKGAALDVFEVEPLAVNNPLWSLPNVIISPHCSAVHADWAIQAFDLFLENLQRWQSGRPLSNIVHPDRGY
jgi:phosphoglycerate dehydrogenase-like enzyme